MKFFVSQVEHSFVDRLDQLLLLEGSPPEDGADSLPAFFEKILENTIRSAAYIRLVSFIEKPEQAIDAEAPLASPFGQAGAVKNIL